MHRVPRRTVYEPLGVPAMAQQCRRESHADMAAAVVVYSVVRKPSGVSSKMLFTPSVKIVSTSVTNRLVDGRKVAECRGVTVLHEGAAARHAEKREANTMGLSLLKWAVGCPPYTTAAG